MTSNIREYSAARAALSVLKSLGRGFAVVAGGLFSVFVAVLHAGVDQDHEELDDNGNQRGDPSLEPRSNRPARFASYYEDPVDF